MVGSAAATTATRGELKVLPAVHPAGAAYSGPSPPPPGFILEAVTALTTDRAPEPKSVSKASSQRPVPKPALGKIVSPLNTGLPYWARQFLRQVQTLPQGKLALHQLLSTVQRLMDKAATLSRRSHSQVIKAYLLLAAVDISEKAWKQRSLELQLSQEKLAHVS
jgi:hypothetical protein